MFKFLLFDVGVLRYEQGRAGEPGLGFRLTVDVGRPAAVGGVTDGRVVHQLILQVQHRLRAPDEQDGIAVVQPAHLVRS